MSRTAEQIVFARKPTGPQILKIRKWLENFDIEFCGSWMIVYGWTLGNGQLHKSWTAWASTNAPDLLCVREFTNV